MSTRLKFESMLRRAFPGHEVLVLQHGDKLEVVSPGSVRTSG